MGRWLCVDVGFVLVRERDIVSDDLLKAAGWLQTFSGGWAGRALTCCKVNPPT